MDSAKVAPHKGTYYPALYSATCIQKAKFPELDINTLLLNYNTYTGNSLRKDWIKPAPARSRSSYRE